MKHINLGLAFHNHQPVGNFPWVFEEAYRSAYLPMLKALERHPRVRLSLHYSGPLLDWLRVNHPDFTPRVAALARRGQVEIMGGPYYEPILPAIPDADKVGQMLKTKGVLEQEFGSPPTGLWLPERVWEPHLPKALAQGGMEWTLVDDNHFRMVGLEETELFGYYITEEEGFAIKIFPSLKRLRYSIPWHPVEEVIQFLQGQASEDGARLAVMGDDGEKFGSWPGTYRHCWTEKWIDRFFAALEDSRGWLHTILLGEYARNYPPQGRIYLPTASYNEMQEWALPPALSHRYVAQRHQLEEQGRQDLTRYMYGGFWRHFLAKYPEANNMHKKMLRVHAKVYSARSQSQEDCGLDELWQGQCNCPYWHGVFGGLYLTDVRAATYRHLIGAENAADAVLHPQRGWLEWEETDFDRDGVAELLIDAQPFSLCISPAQGGTLLEWDLRQKSFNILSTLARRQEAYHLAATETQDNNTVHSIHDGIRWKDEVAPSFYYDPYPRYSLRDHFLSPEATLESFARAEYREMGDFAVGQYAASARRKGKALAITLTREGALESDAGRFPLRLQKRLSLSANKEELAVSYTITNAGHKRVESLFAAEWNLNLLGGGHNDAAYMKIPHVPLDDPHLDAWGEHADVREIILGNRALGIRLRLKLGQSMRLWRFPVETISNSEAGLEKTYQATCLVLLTPLTLEAGEGLELAMRWLW